MSSLPVPLSPHDQHRRVAVGHAGHEVEDPLHRLALAEEAAEALRVDDGAAEPLHLLPELTVLERPPDHQGEELGVDRLGDEVVGAGANRGHRGVEARVAGDHDHRDVGPDAEDALAQLGSAERGHAEIGEDHVEIALGDELERVEPGGAPLDLERITPEHQLQHLAHRLIVIDDENSSTHAGLVGNMRIPLRATRARSNRATRGFARSCLGADNPVSAFIISAM